MHSTSAARALVAAFLGSGQMQAFPERIQQSDSRVKPELVSLAIHLQHHIGQT
jgi:hypothetical protein